MKISIRMNVFMFFAFLLIFTQNIISVSTSQFYIEMLEEEILLGESNQGLRLKNTIKNNININNRYKAGQVLKYRDL